MVLYKTRTLEDGSQEGIAIINCACGTHSIRISFMKDDEAEDYIFLELWTQDFYGKQKDPLYARIWDKMKKIWAIIRGQEYRLTDVALDKSEINDVIEALNEVVKNSK